MQDKTIVSLAIKAAIFTVIMIGYSLGGFEPTALAVLMFIVYLQIEGVLNGR